MKRERKCKNTNYELYKYLDAKSKIDDTRYWGLFRLQKNKEHTANDIKIDPKRFQKMTYHHFTEEQLKIFNDPATTEIYTEADTLSLHDALPI